MDQIPAAMDRHLDVIYCHKDGGFLLGASSLTGRYWYGSLWYYEEPTSSLDVEKCTAGVQLEAGIGDALWIDRDKVLIGLDTGGLAVWQLVDNYKTFVQVCAAGEHDNVVNTVSISADNKKALSASHDRCLKIWDLETLNSTATYRAHSNIVWSAQYHPTECDIFLSCSQDGRILLWDSRKSRPASIVDKSPLQLCPTACTWQNGDGYAVAVGDEEGRIIVKDVRNLEKRPTCSYMPHHRPVHRLQFQPENSNILASASEDCSVVVGCLSGDNIEQIYKNTAHQDFVQGICWNHGHKLLSCGWDSVLLTHDLSGLKNMQSIGTVTVKVNGHQTSGNEMKTEHFEKTSCCEEKISSISSDSIKAK